MSTAGRWLTGDDIDNVQTLLHTQWQGDGLKLVTREFTVPLRRPFIHVKSNTYRNNIMLNHAVNRDKSRRL